MRAFSYAWPLSVTRQMGVHAVIQSAISENPMLHANLMALCFVEGEVWPIEVYIAGIRIFDFFFSMTLTLTR